MWIDLGWHFPRKKESLSILELILKHANIRKGKDVARTLILVIFTYQGWSFDSQRDGTSHWRAENSGPKLSTHVTASNICFTIFVEQMFLGCPVDEAAARGLEIEDIDADGDGNIDFQAGTMQTGTQTPVACGFAEAVAIILALCLRGILHLFRETECDLFTDTCPSHGHCKEQRHQDQDAHEAARSHCGWPR